MSNKIDPLELCFIFTKLYNRIFLFKEPFNKEDKEEIIIYKHEIIKHGKKFFVDFDKLEEQAVFLEKIEEVVAALSDNTNI